jgi:hypothetical protein
VVVNTNRDAGCASNGQSRNIVASLFVVLKAADRNDLALRNNDVLVALWAVRILELDSFSSCWNEFLSWGNAFGDDQLGVSSTFVIGIYFRK